MLHLVLLGLRVGFKRFYVILFVFLAPMFCTSLSVPYCLSSLSWSVFLLLGFALSLLCRCLLLCVVVRSPAAICRWSGAPCAQVCVSVLLLSFFVPFVAVIVVALAAAVVAVASLLLSVCLGCPLCLVCLFPACLLAIGSGSSSSMYHWFSCSM